MERSHILSSVFVVISLLFIVSANDDGYKMLSYGTVQYPWQRVNSREWIPRMQRTEDRKSKSPDLDNRAFPTIEMEKCADGRYHTPKRTSTFEEEMAEHKNIGRGSGVRIYGAGPVPVILVPNYDRPQQ